MNIGIDIDEYQIKDDTVTRVDSWKEIYETIKRIQNVKLA